MSQSELTPIGDLVPGGAFSIRDLNWSQVSNDYARRTFRYDGFSTPFNVGDYYEVSEKVLALYAMADRRRRQTQPRSRRSRSWAVCPSRSTGPCARNATPT